MSTAAQLFGAFFILCAIGAIGAVLAEAMEFDCPCRDWLALRNSDLTDKRLAAGRRHLVPSRAVARALAGTMELAADRLSALFLLIAGLVFLPVSIFSAVYLGKYRKHYSLQYFGVLGHALFASIVLILTTNDSISFLVSWRSCRSRAISS